MTWGRGLLALGLLALAACGGPSEAGEGTTPGPAAASASSLRVLLAGDSITVGYYATDVDRSYAALLLDEWGTEREVSAVRAEEAGARAWRIGRLVGEQDLTGIDVAVIEVGANDVGKTSVRTYAGDVAALVERIDQGSPEAVTVCLGPWNEPRASRRYDRAVRRVCDDDTHRYVAISDLYADPTMHGPVGAETAFGTRDYFHPNDLAHAEIARRVAEAIGG